MLIVEILVGFSRVRDNKPLTIEGGASIGITLCLEVRSAVLRKTTDSVRVIESECFIVRGKTVRGLSYKL